MVRKIGMGKPTAIRWNIPDHWVDELQLITERIARNVDEDGQRANHSVRAQRAAARVLATLKRQKQSINADSDSHNGITV